MQALPNPLQFNNDIFYPNMWDSTTKQQLQECKLMNTAARDAIHVLRKVGLEVYLADFVFAKTPDIDARVSVITRDGTTLLFLREYSRHYEKKGNLNTIEMTCRLMKLKERGETNSVSSLSVPYVIKALKKVAVAIRADYDKISHGTSVDFLISVVPTYAESKMDNPSHKTQVSIPMVDLAVLVGLVNGTMTMESLSPLMVARVNASRDAVKRITDAHEAVRNLVGGYFSLPKWVVQYHAPQVRGHEGFCSVGAFRIKDFFKVGSRADVPPNAVLISGYVYDVEWLLPLQVYKNVNTFLEIADANAAEDLSLAIKTELIRNHNNELYGVPFNADTNLDFDSGVANMRYSRASSNSIHAFMCDCNVVL